MKRIKIKIKDCIAITALFGAFFSLFGLIALYFIGVFCLPIVLIWAIYKIVTHFFN
jgi:hypothetical protein